LRRLPRPLVAVCLVSIGVAVVPTAFAGDRAYWTDTGGKISFANLDGSGGADLTTTGATVSDPQGVAFDPVTNRIYWANVSGSTIAYAKLDGSSGGVLPTAGATINGPVGVAIDPATGRIYWGNTGGPTRISFANLDGTGGGDVVTGAATVNQPAGVAVDPALGRIYWANVAGNKISYANLDGSGGADLATGGATVSAPVGVAVDTATGRVYWANQGANKISFANLDGSGGGDLVTTGATVNVPTGVAIDPASGRIYWGNFSGNTISYANLDGSGGGDLAAAGATLTHSVFPLLLQAPRGTGVPVVSGGAVVGSTLSCTPGSWAPDAVASLDYRAPQSFVYGWSIGGTTIAGATSSSIIASAPGGYSCQVTASNQIGPAVQSSVAFTVNAALSPPPLPPLRPVQTLVVLGGLSISPHGMRAASSGRLKARKTGATVSYTDSQAGITTLTVLRSTRGFERSGRCVARRPTGKKRASRCTLYKVVGSFHHTDTAGRNSLHFNGRLRGTKLKPGAYRLQAIPRSGGRSGAAHSTGFQVVR
jgi:DNA-binding beta-propeller fold protein YncE